MIIDYNRHLITIYDRHLINIYYRQLQSTDADIDCHLPHSYMTCTTWNLLKQQLLDHVRAHRRLLGGVRWERAPAGGYGISGRQ